MEILTEIKNSLELIFNKFSNVNSVNNEVLTEIVKRKFVYSEVEPNKKVLFVGMNPSYDEKSEYKQSYKVQDTVESYPKYYRKFKDISDRLLIGNDWTYTDLFYFRETNQEKIYKLLSEPDGLIFICEQLQLTINILEKIKPEIIVVCNSGARRFLGLGIENKKGKDENVWMGYKFEFNEKYGVDVITGIHQQSLKEIKTTQLCGTPVFFSSILTGQRALDKGSYERLKWHIGEIVKRTKIKE